MVDVPEPVMVVGENETDEFAGFPVEPSVTVPAKPSSADTVTV
jgi:hypothetical protein